MIAHKCLLAQQQMPCLPGEYHLSFCVRFLWFWSIFLIFKWGNISRYCLHTVVRMKLQIHFERMSKWTQQFSINAFWLIFWNKWKKKRKSKRHPKTIAQIVCMSPLRLHSVLLRAGLSNAPNVEVQAPAFQKHLESSFPSISVEFRCLNIFEDHP